MVDRAFMEAGEVSRTAAIESDSLSLLITAYINSMRFSYQLEIVLQAVTSLNMYHLPAYLL